MTPAVRIVAIDGPAGAGKTSLARGLARHLGWAHLDTGAMYRAVTVLAIRQGIPPQDEDSLASLARSITLTLLPDGRVLAGGEELRDELRSDAVNEAVSLVAAHPAVRAVMVRHQRRFARQHRAIVAEGRDMGSVVFPRAHVKIWLDAAPLERAGRRWRERGQEGGGARDPADILSDLERRDRLDRSRAVAPLRPAAGAWRLDTSGMTLDQVFEAVKAHVEEAIRS